MTYTCPLKARSLFNGFVEFTLEDVPVKIDSKHFILQNRFKSPILIYKTICVGCDIEGLYDGDIVECRNEKLTISSIDGNFYAVKDDDTRIPVKELQDYKVVGNIYDGINMVPKSPLYKYRDKTFMLSHIVGAYENVIFIDQKTGIRLSEIRQYSGCNLDRKLIFYGDVLFAGIADIYQGQLVSNQDGEYYDLEKRRLQ